MLTIALPRGKSLEHRTLEISCKTLMASRFAGLRSDTRESVSLDECAKWRHHGRVAVLQIINDTRRDVGLSPVGQPR